jgi:hypothetical protein
VPSQTTFRQLPQAGTLTGTEVVPVDQNGQTVQTTIAAIAGVVGGINPEAYITPAALPAGLTSNWNPPGLGNASIIRVSSGNQAFSIDGIAAPAGPKFMLLINANTAEADMTIVDASASASFAQNQILVQHKANVAIGFQGGVWFYYDEVAVKWVALV